MRLPPITNTHKKGHKEMRKYRYVTLKEMTNGEPVVTHAYTLNATTEDGSLTEKCTIMRKLCPRPDGPDQWCFYGVLPLAVMEHLGIDAPELMRRLLTGLPERLYP